MKKARHQKKTYYAGGSSQSERSHSALQVDNFKIDEKGLAEYLAFLYKYSDHIHFFNLKNKVAGTWQPFLGSDLSILLARIAINNPEQLDARFNETLYRFENELDESVAIRIYADLMGQVHALVYMLNEWYGLSHKFSDEHDSELGTIIENAIEYRLRKKYKDVTSLAENQRNEGFKVNFKEDATLDAIWTKPGPLDEEKDLKVNPEETLKDAAKKLAFLFKDFLRTIIYIINSVPRLLEKTLHHDHHAPQNALLITFLKLYEHVKGDLNKITRKHLDYYFFEKLGQSLCGSVADKVHLSFLLAPNVGEYLIRKGTLMAAGVDADGYDYLYSVDQDIRLNQAAIADIKVLYLSKHAAIAQGARFKITSNIYQKEISPVGRQLPFATFGEEQHELPAEKQSMLVSEIGFAASSPVLLMKEGERKVAMDLKFSLKSMSSLASFLEDLTTTEQLSAVGAFHKVFANAFQIELSSAQGWYKIKNYRITPRDNWTDGILSLEFKIGMGEPPIVPLPQGHGENVHFNSKWPVLKMSLSTAHAMYAYSYLRDLVLEECEFRVEASQVKGLTAFNNIGKLDISGPFFPLGTIPLRGAFMLIGNDEIFTKKLDWLSLKLDWANLPALENGFKEYYNRYDEGISNDSFRVSVSALSDYRFQPDLPENRQVYPLFETKATAKGMAENQRLEPTTLIQDVDIDKLQMEPNYSMGNLPDYDNTVKAGYLKLELIAPEMGFGSEKYPNIFASEVMQKGMLSGTKKLELPNPPFAPLLRSVQLSYRSSSKIYFGKSATRRSDPEADEKFYHLNPFGVRAIFKEAAPTTQLLLPQLGNDGYLFIGLNGVAPSSTLALYFLLEQDVGNNFTIEIPEVHWHYLLEDEWKSFGKGDILSDTTDNFTVSGIVKLTMPVEISTDNHILPKGLFWISARVNGDVSLLSKTRGIYTNAVSASWVPHRSHAQWSANIPAGTIQRFVGGKSEIAAILQPAPSFGGVAAENASRFYSRVSERLQHKNRAVTVWDYEHLLLQQFPMVDRVKCITPLDGEERVKGGLLVLVVVPPIVHQGDFYLPKINYNLLGEMEAFMAGLASPFAKIRVINPVYEKVKVTCNVKFVDNSRKGEYIQQLHEDIRKFICPWFYNPASRMRFGGYLRQEEVFTFIESLDYIRFITKLSLVIVHFDRQKYTLSDSIEITEPLYASAPWSILVPMEKHQVSIIEKPVHETPEKSAIERMRVGGDFVVTGEASEREEEDFPIYNKDDDDHYRTIEIKI